MRNQMYNVKGFVVAEDVVGGLFLLLEDETIGYLAPDTLQLTHFDMEYQDLLTMCLYSDNTDFYRNLRWEGWEKDVEKLASDEGIMFYPMLWAGGDKETSSKKAIPMQELVSTDKTLVHIKEENIEENCVEDDEIEEDAECDDASGEYDKLFPYVMFDENDESVDDNDKFLDDMIFMDLIDED